MTLAYELCQQCAPFESVSRNTFFNLIYLSSTQSCLTRAPSEVAFDSEEIILFLKAIQAASFYCSQDEILSMLKCIEVT